MMLAQDIEFVVAGSSPTSGFLVVSVSDHDEIHGYVWEHRLADGTTTWVAEKRHSVAGNGGGIPGFQPKEWAGQFLYDHEWPTYIRRD
ncbi:hypothetical protein SAZ11_08570 [Streptomyces sp. FXJ1.4098]|nr:hypothetical protein [Streptomyces sp. FXJ1.4098]